MIKCVSINHDLNYTLLVFHKISFFHKLKVSKENLEHWALTFLNPWPEIATNPLGGHTGLWNIGMWHFRTNRSSQSQMDPNYSIWIPKVIILAPKTFQRFMVCFWEIFFEKIERFSVKCSSFVNFWARKTFFFLNRSEFRQKLIGTIIRVLMRHPMA